MLKEIRNGNYHFDAGSSAAVKRAIRYNAETDSTWKHHELIKTLYEWSDILIATLVDPVAKPGIERMPAPAIGIDRDDVRVNAYYRLGKNAMGVDDEIIINEQRIDRPLYGILETLTHELLHLKQQRRGEHPVKSSKNTHNKEFCDWAEAIGLHPMPVVGCHWKPADGAFEALLKQHGILKPQIEETPKGKFDWWAIDVKPKGRSTLEPWECPDCGFKVRIGKKLEESPIACVPCSREKGELVPFVKA